MPTDYFRLLAEIKASKQFKNGSVHPESNKAYFTDAILVVVPVAIEEEIHTWDTFATLLFGPRFAASSIIARF